MSMLKKAVVVSIPSVRQALARSNPVAATALLARRAYNSKGGVEVITSDAHRLSIPSLSPLLDLDLQHFLLKHHHLQIDHGNGMSKIERGGERVQNH